VNLAIAVLLALSGCGDDDDDVGPGADAGDDPRDGGGDGGEGRDASHPGDDAGRDAGDDGGQPGRVRTLWITVGGQDRLAVAELGEDGQLAERPEDSLDLPGSPAAMAFARATRRLYVGLDGDAIATIDLDGEGRPSLAGVTQGVGSAVYLAVAHGESVLVTGDFGADDLSTFDVSGDPPHAETDRTSTSNEPHQTLLGPTGDRVYVPHRTADVVRWFGLDAGGGLSFEDEVDADPGDGPRHLVFSPDGAYAWLVHEFSDSVSSHRVGDDGALERFDVAPTLPDGVDGSDNSCADIHVTPDGRHVYASNRGHDSIARFTVQGDGSLAFDGTTSTEARPREFDPSPDGRFLVVAGQDSGFAASYAIESDGDLAPVDRLELGADLRWIAIE
jgi:6-phosphogluconolactonase